MLLKSSMNCDPENSTFLSNEKYLLQKYNRMIKYINYNWFNLDRQKIISDIQSRTMPVRLSIPSGELAGQRKLGSTFSRTP